VSASKPYEGSIGRPDRVTFEPKGYRDVIWCPYGNEPTFLSWGRDNLPQCDNCNGNWEAETHPFICHILKT
jgi:hypothetical protein